LRGERRSLRTFSPGASLRPPLAFNPDTPRRLSTPLLTPFNSTPTFARRGRNENGQLGLGDTVDRGIPTVIKELQDKGAKAIDGACGKHHTVILCEGGVTYAFGSNKHGQLGIGTIARKARPISSHWSPYDRVGVVNAVP
jgi:hypothetical protein